MRKLFVCALVLLVAGSVFGGVFPADHELLTNGNFETGDLSGWSWDTFSPYIITDTPPEGSGQGGIGGNYAAEMAWVSGQWFTQNFYLIPDNGFGDPLPEDVEVRLTLWYSGHVDYRIRDTFGGIPAGILDDGSLWWAAYQDPTTPNPDGIPPEWTFADTASLNYPFGGAGYRDTKIIVTVPAGTINLTVEFRGTYGGIPLQFDNVSLKTAPAPATLALLGLGLIALLIRRRR